MYKSIVISGQIAAGTSTAAKSLSEKLNLPYHSAGDFFRKYMLEHNIPLHAKDKIPNDLEQKIDQSLSDLTDSPAGTVIDAHYAGYFNREKPYVLKVLLTCDQNERIKRAVSRVHTHSETADDIKKREDGLDAKFRKLYANENFLDPKFFDLTIDTTEIPPEETLERIIDKFKS